MPALGIAIKTDTRLNIVALFTTADTGLGLGCTIRCGRGGDQFTEKNLAFRTAEWELRCTERALAHSVILAAQIANETEDGHAYDLALESVREGIAALLYAKAHAENRTVADELMGCIIASFTVTDPEVIKRRNAIIDIAVRQSESNPLSMTVNTQTRVVCRNALPHLSDCDPITGQEYGTGA